MLFHKCVDDKIRTWARVDCSICPVSDEAKYRSFNPVVRIAELEAEIKRLRAALQSIIANDILGEWAWRSPASIAEAALAPGGGDEET